MAFIMVNIFYFVPYVHFVCMGEYDVTCKFQNKHNVHVIGESRSTNQYNELEK